MFFLIHIYTKAAVGCCNGSWAARRKVFHQYLLKFCIFTKAAAECRDGSWAARGREFYDQKTSFIHKQLWSARTAHGLLAGEFVSSKSFVINMYAIALGSGQKGHELIAGE